MALERVKKAILFTRLVAYGFRVSVSILRRAVSVKFAALTTRTLTPPTDHSEVKNVVVVGAAFAGYFAARILAASLPRDGRYRVVVIEPNTHFNFTWVLPRFSVVGGHEHKAFIPYTPAFFAQGPKDVVRWVRDRVTSVRKGSVVLRSGDEIPYEFLIIATGSTVANGLPSRLGVETREEGMGVLKAMQARIKAANRVVIAGGGAAGVELATDAKNQYPDKSVTLVHSRQAVMHRFGPGLQKDAMDALQRLGVDVILGERVDSGSADGKFIALGSGRKVECDCFVGRVADIQMLAGQINCTGQRPASRLIAELAPDAIAPSGHIRVKPTLQIDDESLPNVFVCGDVADTKDTNPNSRIAGRQAEIAADNVVLAATGKEPSYTYSPGWGDGVIKLTLGLDRSTTHFWDGESELLFSHQEADLALMCGRAWAGVSAKPFEDTGMYSS
ncbi:apoptosis-inducing factor 2 [Chaetomidium leptoderma]|uniref:Apoptosis-inducing factor 2 n=1 Tax=Chaetomidium leptoderma TaxID=669021 RepID=A0AAN6VIP3_9PEZI|nr:apoptosis-inducing factor 2 [Chaetomidium leptoderma]